MVACTGAWLGRVLVACTERGICAILIGEDDATLRADLARSLPKAAVTEAWPAFEQHVSAIVHLIETPGVAHDLKLDMRGTAFQQKVWQALAAIPGGTTVSYGDLAERLGSRRQARAVAAACAANRLAVAIPCHRVVTARGEMAGYRWGIARKRALLEREKG